MMDLADVPLDQDGNPRITVDLGTFMRLKGIKSKQTARQLIMRGILPATRKTPGVRNSHWLVTPKAARDYDKNVTYTENAFHKYR